MAIKEQVFATLADVAKPGAILATNTSTLDVDRIAAGTKRPQDVLGMHFFSPANVMKLLEVVRGAATGADVLATVMQLAKRIGKTAVVARRMRRLHWQSDGRAISAAGDVPGRRGRVAGASRWRAGDVRHGDGAVPHERPGRQRYRLADPAATLRREAACRVLADRRSSVRARSLRPEGGRRLVSVRIRATRRAAGPSGG